MLTPSVRLMRKQVHLPGGTDRVTLRSRAPTRLPVRAGESPGHALQPACGEHACRGRLGQAHHAAPDARAKGPASRRGIKCYETNRSSAAARGVSRATDTDREVAPRSSTRLRRGIALSAIPANAAGSATALYTNGAATSGACTVAHTIHLNKNLLLFAVANGCPWRVWLHETNNNRGYNFCISPAHNGSATYETVPQVTYADLWVRGNSTNC
jgi:hypothetical protein